MASRFGEAARAVTAEGERTRQLSAGLSDEHAARVLWDDWTIGDVLGHVAASHHGLLRRMRGDPPPAAPGQTLAEINEARRQQRRGWPLARVLADLEEG